MYAMMTHHMIHEALHTVHVHEALHDKNNTHSLQGTLDLLSTFNLHEVSSSEF